MWVRLLGAHLQEQLHVGEAEREKARKTSWQKHIWQGFAGKCQGIVENPSQPWLKHTSKPISEVFEKCQPRGYNPDDRVLPTLGGLSEQYPYSFKCTLMYKDYYLAEPYVININVTYELNEPQLAAICYGGGDDVIFINTTCKSAIKHYLPPHKSYGLRGITPPKSKYYSNTAGAPIQCLYSTAAVNSGLAIRFLVAKDTPRTGTLLCVLDPPRAKLGTVTTSSMQTPHYSRIDEHLFPCRHLDLRIDEHHYRHIHYNFRTNDDLLQHNQLDSRVDEFFIHHRQHGSSVDDLFIHHRQNDFRLDDSFIHHRQHDSRADELSIHTNQLDFRSGHKNDIL
ncbi:hypothetical protein ANCCEY_00762 [Ancylostoma ceylanicum]|uniref:Uncharacterized protein n=1 Tax=Ancylostoma ceylanicum TaxID=53326 RepID=A0A0D6MD82_9BILA|nr:hypothetical protein ANCCEY_00762 [Ancylostoma ceylanicum]